MSTSIGNSSKEIKKADDSAATLLVEILKGTPGRNFDVESIFVEKQENGRWRWVVYEFLKSESGNAPPEVSHPNYYWHLNSRKFLSLWTLVHALRASGSDADLILVNYSEDRSQLVKEMLVKFIDVDSKKIIRKATNVNGNFRREIREYVSTTDSTMSFEKWKERFRKFNDTKKGETWELLESFSVPKADSSHIPSSKEQPVCQACKQHFIAKFNGAKLCFKCWREASMQ